LRYASEELRSNAEFVMKCAKLNALSVRAASETLMEDEDREEEVMAIIFAAGEAHDLKVAEAEAKAAAERAAAKEAKRLEQRQAMIDRGEDPDAIDEDENNSGANSNGDDNGDDDEDEDAGDR